MTNRENHENLRSVCQLFLVFLLNDIEFLIPQKRKTGALTSPGYFDEMKAKLSPLKNLTQIFVGNVILKPFVNC